MSVFGLRERVTAYFLATILLVAPAWAQENIPLEVIGSDDQSTSMTRADIEALPQAEFDTSTIWTDGTIRFSGVPLVALLEHAGVSGETLVMTALNDYSVEVPIAEIAVDYPIVATRMDGEPMSVRDKGPYWVIYPFDDMPELQTETSHARSIWQLVRLTVKE